VDVDAEPAPFEIEGIVRENTDSLLVKRVRGTSGTGSILLAAGNDSSFSAGNGGIDYQPVDLGFDLGIDLPL
jgi:hypothetical protein